MLEENIIKQAISFHQEKNKFVYSQTKHNVVEFWFDLYKKNDPEINSLLDDLGYKSPTFVNWWESIYNKTIKYKFIKDIFDFQINSLSSLYQLGKTDVVKNSSYAKTGFIDPSNWRVIDDKLMQLCFALYVLLNKAKMSSDKTKNDVYEKAFSVTLSGNIVPSRARGTSYNQKQKSLIWEEIPHEAMKSPFKIDINSFKTTNGYHDSYDFLSKCFDKFITETYYDYDDERAISIAGFNFPHVKNIALRNLIGLSEAKKFDNITENQKQPANFDEFWKNIKRNYNKSTRIQQILNEKVDICPPQPSNQLVKTQTNSNIPIEKIILVKQWLDNYAKSLPCYKDFENQTQYNSSFAINDFISWWKNIVSTADPAKQLILNQNVVTNFKFFQFGLHTVDKDNANSNTFYIPAFILQYLNHYMIKFIESYCPQKSLAIITSNNSSVINRVSDYKQEDLELVDLNKIIFSSNENIMFNRYSQKNKPANCEVDFYSLGFKSTSEIAELRTLVKLTEELFTLIRVNEHLQLLKQAKIGKNIAEFVSLVNEATDVPSQIGNILLGPALDKRF